MIERSFVFVLIAMLILTLLVGCKEKTTQPPTPSKVASPILNPSGGNFTHDYTYSGSNVLDNVAWYLGNSGWTNHLVGLKIENELGLWDMTGNIWEWLWDIAGAYPSGQQTNPHGQTNGQHRSLRGGSWQDAADICPVTLRNQELATTYHINLGFRVVRNTLQ